MDSDWSDDLNVDEYPEEPWDDDSTELVACVNCGAEVYEDAPACPECGHWLTPDTHPLRGRSWWWVVLGLLGIAAVILAMLPL